MHRRKQNQVGSDSLRSVYEHTQWVQRQNYPATQSRTNQTAPLRNGRFLTAPNSGVGLARSPNQPPDLPEVRLQ